MRKKHRCIFVRLLIQFFMLLGGVVLGQRFDDEVETQPQAPTVMVKGHWKHQRHDKEQHQDALVIRADYQ